MVRERVRVRKCTVEGEESSRVEVTSVLFLRGIALTGPVGGAAAPRW